MAQLCPRRDELNREIPTLQDELPTGIPALTTDKIAILSQAMRQRLEQGPSELKQAYMRLFLDKVELHQDEISLAGPKAVLAKAALKGLPSSVPEVLICVRQWRATNDKAENWTISRPLTAMPDGKQSGLSLYYDARVVFEPPKSPFRKSS